MAVHAAGSGAKISLYQFMRTFFPNVRIDFKGRPVKRPAPNPKHYDYPFEELEAALRRAIRDRGLRSLSLDDRRQRFLFEGCRYGTAMGWLSEGQLEDIDEQSSRVVWTVTPAGVAHFTGKEA